MIKMSSNGWYSKKDVIKDLVEVTGKCFNDLGEHYVVGENPPPSWRTDEDLDLSQFYGGQKLMNSDTMEKPDLVGITQMLRMVDNYYETPHDFSTSNGEHMKPKTSNTEPTDITITTVSISKLNPNVNEFVPQNLVSNSSIDVVSKVSKKELKVAKDVNLNDKETFKTDCCDTVKTKISINKIDISQLLSSELKEMREQLKTKICDTSKVKCVKLRRDRNLAIATLLKLHCQKPADENKPNLICPDYFKNNPANKNDITEQNYLKKVSKNYTDDNFTENNLNTSSEAEIIKKEIAASVEKVTRWLHNSEPDKISEQYNKDIKEPTPFIPEIQIPIKKTTKGPSIHLGPVTFKKKTNNNHPATTMNSQTMSPVSLQSDNSKSKSETFVPSVYASELAKRYIQQSLQKQETQTDIWTSLENQLKDKSEAIIYIKNNDFRH